MKPELEKEWKIYRDYSANGHIELTIGIGILLFFTVVMLSVEGYLYLKVAIVLLMVLMPVLWHKLVRVPRVGQVEYSSELLGSIIARSFIQLFATGFCYFIFLFGMMAISDWLDRWMNDEAGIALLFAVPTNLFFLGTAIFRRAKMHYLLAGVNTLWWISLVLFKINFVIGFMGIGAILAVAGGYKVIDFLRKHPRVKVAGSETDHDYSPEEIAAIDREQIEWGNYSLMTGVIEFIMVSIFIRLIPTNYTSSIDWISTVSFGVILIATALWFSYAMNRKFSAAGLAKSVRAIYERNPYWLYLAIFLPVMIFSAMEDRLPHEHATNLFPYYDLIILGGATLPTIVFGWFGRIKLFSVKMIGVIVLYVVLRLCGVPVLLDVAIAGVLSVILGVLRVLEFNKLPAIFVRVPDLSNEGVVKP